jgi:adenylate cyclase
VLSDPDFRALFSEDFLADDVTLSVGEQTLLFTDIVGSTAMYAQRGDPDAFTSVRRQFSETFALVARHRGVVVKTIGDATMAAFVDPVDAVQAAVAIQRAFADPAGIRLRVSINTGPCLAVRLNADIDYFGHAVNVAAKLQSIVEAGQVALAERTRAAPGVAAALAELALPVEELAVTIKGVSSATTAHRFTVS